MQTQTTVKLYSEHLDVCLLSSFAYSKASMTKFGSLASCWKQFGYQWVLIKINGCSGTKKILMKLEKTVVQAGTGKFIMPSLINN